MGGAQAVGFFAALPVGSPTSASHAAAIDNLTRFPADLQHISLSTYTIVTVHTRAIRKVALRAFRCYAAIFAHESALPSSAQLQSDFRASTNLPVAGGRVNCNIQYW